ncbi:MAG: VIT1/CCC1 transporter family protein, partial [bacterium]|nr:VIT1/CCC1 transporter family protein [bacterium]
MNRITRLQKAHRQQDMEAVKKEHTHQAIQHHLDHPDEHQEAGKYLPEAVYGASDGIVTTFAIVSGVVGADLSTSIILILGFANLLADGFSMAAGNYLSIKSEKEYHREEYRREKWEVENYPKGEIEEIRQIYEK